MCVFSRLGTSGDQAPTPPKNFFQKKKKQLIQIKVHVFLITLILTQV